MVGQSVPEEFEHLLERLGGGSGLHVRHVGHGDVFGAFHVPAFGSGGPRPFSPHRQGAHAGVFFLAIDVDVGRDALAVFGGLCAFGQVVVHDFGALGVPDHDDLGLAAALLERFDRFFDLFFDFAVVILRRGPQRVVVERFDPAVRVAVAFEAHLLRGEVRAGALNAVHEQHGTAFVGRRIRPLHASEQQCSHG